jgi:hypothetical protein
MEVTLQKNDITLNCYSEVSPNTKQLPVQANESSSQL